MKDSFFDEHIEESKKIDEDSAPNEESKEDVSNIFATEQAAPENPDVEFAHEWSKEKETIAP